MTIDLGRLTPQAGRGVVIDSAVRVRLAQSIDALCERIRPVFPHDPSAAARLVDTIERGPVRPAVFAMYADLVGAITSGDVAAAERAVGRLLQADPAGGATQVAMLDDADLGAGMADLYARTIDDDPNMPLALAPIADRQYAVDSIDAALALIDTSAPDMGAEIRTLVREIVAAQPAANPNGRIRNFDGATSFYLWGAVVVNLVDRTTLGLAQTLAHETGHLLLFGLTPGEPLVENPDDERHASPLRQDPRPMEGLVHAAYVIARMHYILAAALKAGVLSDEQGQTASAQAAGYVDSFFDAAATIERHARFKPAGAAVFRSAADYMEAEAGRRTAVASA